VCGIVGVYEYGRTAGDVSAPLLLRMRETLRHRGPDGEGVFVSVDQKAGLAHRRLSIVDPAGGAQPMHGNNGTVLVFNGEIYNYPALRKSLESGGIRFRTNSDTEVILHLYELYGERCVEHLVGMFAFALWDDRRDQLFFARDPIGEKPFYWSNTGSVFIFGSEIKAVLEHPSAPREVNEAALGAYLANLVTPGPETLYRGIFKLPAGHRGRCDTNGVTVSRYWRPPTARRWVDVPIAEAADRVRTLLDTSVHDRLMSDVPVGVLLSGGFDSTAIVALLRESRTGMPTFTVGFPGFERVDERSEARWVAREFRTDHHEVALAESDAVKMLVPLVHHQDEPLADPVCVPLFAVCRLAREAGVKVVLAGEGADELFWGYSAYRSALARWHRYRAALSLPRPLRLLLRSTTSGHRRSRRREQLEGIAEGRLRPIQMPAGLTSYQRQELLLSRTSASGWSPAARAQDEDSLSTLVFDTQEYEFQVRLPELLLMRIDRFSMANGVEARVPFLDPALVEYVYRLPLDLKLKNGVTKVVLKEALAGVMPRRTVDRRKQGFAAPTSEWFAARHGALLARLAQEEALRRYFDIGHLARLARALDFTHPEAGRILWPILNFALWHRYWIEGASPDELVVEEAEASRRSTFGLAPHALGEMR
jgi:asparagine synthase (glutamine-hydrolysing)